MPSGGWRQKPIVCVYWATMSYRRKPECQGIQECVLYRNMEHGEILEKMTLLMDLANNSEEKLQQRKSLFFECVNGLIETAGSYGFSGNLWHNYLTLLLVNHENTFSKACEIRGAAEGSINRLALHDFEIFRNFTNSIWRSLTRVLELSAVSLVAIIMGQKIQEECLTAVYVTVSVK